MRQGQNNNNKQRSRGRNNNNRNKNQNNANRSFESNGPDVKIRGTAAHIADKYMSLARDALSSGDIVIAENYFQHAEHYNRIVAVAQAAQAERNAQREAQREDRSDDREANSENATENSSDEVDGSGPQPDIAAKSTASDDEEGDRKPRRQNRRPRRAAEPVANDDADADEAPAPRRTASRKKETESELPAFLLSGTDD